MRDRGLIIETVEKDSIASEMELRPGDVVLEINNSPVTDIIDYRYLIAEDNIQVLVEKESGERWLLEIEKDLDEDLGICFKGGGWGSTRRCANNCVFCFVDQMPDNMRPTLYVKDDDYRLSFAQGNFITLTNMAKPDLDRIINLRMGPLYISVHTTNPGLRSEIMGQPRAAQLMDQLRRLADAGIEMHTQAVLCPGINDGKELTRTIDDLGSLWPAVRSLAVVPVGLTAQRQGLYKLVQYDREGALAVVEEVHRWQNIFKKRFKDPLVYASDEFYLLSGVSIPESKDYGDFPQIENGVGLVRLFWNEWEQIKDSLPGKMEKHVRCSLVTGVLAGKVLQPLVDSLNQITGLHLQLHVLENHFFGKTVTVAGLLTGQDIVHQLAGQDLGEYLIIPAVMLREGANVFLDDLTVEDIAKRLNIPVKPVSGPSELINILGLA